MRGTVNGVTTFYPGRHYNKEVSPGATKIQKFYFAGTVTIAVRTLTDSADTLTWVLGDHLGSASTTANADGTLNSVIQYTAFGEIRLTQGLTPTKYRYREASCKGTGQLAQAELGLDFYVSRFFDPVTSHFTSADTLIPEPGKSQSFDRLSYTINNPIKYSDSNGHGIDCGIGDANCNRSNDLRKWKDFTDKKNKKNIFIEKLANYTSSIIYGDETEEQMGEIRENIELLLRYCQQNFIPYLQWNAQVLDLDRNNINPNLLFNPASMAYLFATIRAESLWGLEMHEIEGNSKWYSPYYGRGFIHLTLEENYKEMGENFGFDLVNNPDIIAQNKDLSIRISLRYLILNKSGHYYLGKIQSPNQFAEARAIVNPEDFTYKGEIANWANGYYKIFSEFCNQNSLSTTGSCF